MVSGEGTFPDDIPAGTLVPHWAYIRPSDSGGTFDVNASKLIGGGFFFSYPDRFCGRAMSCVLIF